MWNDFEQTSNVVIYIKNLSYLLTFNYLNIQIVDPMRNGKGETKLRFYEVFGVNSIGLSQTSICGIPNNS